MRFYLSLVLPIILSLISIILIQFHKKPQIQNPNPNFKLFTPHELSQFNGSDPSLPLLLSILGSVFDVSKSPSHYGPTGGYHHFTGKDASRAFVTGDFTPSGLIETLANLTSTEVHSVVEWRGFYNRTYIYVGKLIGRYYDENGVETKHLKGVEAKARRGAQMIEKRKEEEESVKGCNSRWSDSEGSEVWCEDGLYPRLVERPVEIAITGKMSRRCACFGEGELETKGLEVYDGCGYFDHRCKLS